MSHKGKVQLTSIVVAPPDQVAEGDRLFKSHAPWMEAPHARTGDAALLSCNVSKAPALSNPMAPSSAPTGNTCFTLSEMYETQAGVADHFKQAGKSWKDFPALGQWLGKCKSRGFPPRRSSTRSGDPA